MRLVVFLSVVSVGLSLAWLIEPDIWLLTLALFAGGGAAVRGVELSPLPNWWRIVVGAPPAALVFMLWVADGRILVLALWIMFILGLRMAIRGYTSRLNH